MEWERSIQEAVPLSIILCDIDYFKRYNDLYGHQAGDICLTQVAKAIEQSIRKPTDLVARYGGEEFVVILPDTSFEEASYLAEVIQRNIQQLNINHAQSEVANHLTLSLGISSVVPTNDTSATCLVATADKALYESKRRGRNNFRVKLVG